MKNQDLITYYDINEPIEVLGLSSRVYNKLKNEGFEIIEDIIAGYHYNFIFTIDNFGKKSYDEVKHRLLDKCNITIWNYNVNDFRKLNLSSDEIYDVVYKLHIKSVDSLLKISYENLEQSKYSNEIIKKLHSLGYMFDFEKNQEITLTTKIYDTPIYQVSRKFGYLTIEELLKKSLNPKDRNSLYRIRDVGQVKAKKIIDIVHSYGFVFEDEKKQEEIVEEQIEEKKNDTKEVTLSTRLYETPIKNIYSRICYMTIEELLKMSLDPQNRESLYRIRNIGPVRAKKIIDIIHSYGFIFEDEKATLEKNNTLENLYRSFDKEFISNEFYEKINTPEDFENNCFVLYFTKIANNVCKNEHDNNYTNKEIITFLINELVEHKKKLLNISNDISKNLELKKQLKKQ